MSRPPKDFGPVEVADGAPMVLGPVLSVFLILRDLLEKFIGYKEAREKDHQSSISLISKMGRFFIL